MEQDTRTKVIQNFRKNAFRYLVATDVAARGIDIDDISLVVNYDLPEEAEVYIHRIGRTGRNDKMGLAISIIGKDAYFLNAIQAINQGELIMHEPPKTEEVESAQEAFDKKIKRRPIIKEDKHIELHEEILKLHINAGKKTKMRASDIVGTLCSIENVTKEDIGNIDILDISTYVEILNNKGEHVLKVLQTKPIKGRVRNVSKSDGTIVRNRRKF
jgi:superfamily II DNA/RNA helicase